MYFPIIQPVLTACSLAAAGLACCTDLRSRSVPNWLTGSAIIVGLAVQAGGGGWSGSLDAIGGLFLCGFTFLAFYLAGGMGAGDVKLMAAEGCMLGAHRSPQLLLTTAIAGGIFAIVIAAKKRRLAQTCRNVASLAAHHRQRGLQPHPELNLGNESAPRLPYALAVAAGVIITLSVDPVSRWLQ